MSTSTGSPRSASNDIVPALGNADVYTRRSSPTSTNSPGSTSSMMVPTPQPLPQSPDHTSQRTGQLKGIHNQRVMHEARGRSRPLSPVSCIPVPIPTPPHATVESDDDEPIQYPFASDSDVMPFHAIGAPCQGPRCGDPDCPRLPETAGQAAPIDNLGPNELPGFENPSQGSWRAPTPPHAEPYRYPGPTRPIPLRDLMTSPELAPQYPVPPYPNVPRVPVPFKPVPSEAQLPGEDLRSPALAPGESFMYNMHNNHLSDRSYRYPRHQETDAGDNREEYRARSPAYRQHQDLTHSNDYSLPLCTVDPENDCRKGFNAGWKGAFHRGHSAGWKGGIEDAKKYGFDSEDVDSLDRSKKPEWCIGWNQGYKSGFAACDMSDVLQRYLAAANPRLLFLGVAFLVYAAFTENQVDAWFQAAMGVFWLCGA